jgi:hypothetical protein
MAYSFINNLEDLLSEKVSNISNDISKVQLERFVEGGEYIIGMLRLYRAGKIPLVPPPEKAGIGITEGRSEIADAQPVKDKINDLKKSILKQSQPVKEVEKAYKFDNGFGTYKNQNEKDADNYRLKIAPNLPLVGFAFERDYLGFIAGIEHAHSQFATEAGGYANGKWWIEQAKQCENVMDVVAKRIKELETPNNLVDVEEVSDILRSIIQFSSSDFAIENATKALTILNPNH